MKAGQGVGIVPAPRPPSPKIPPMPAFPVAPNSQDPGEYAKYKRAYDEYTDWYNKYAELYAAQQDKKNKQGSQQQQQQQSSGDKLPDPSEVPRGVDPVAWRKYCIETREYHARHKNQSTNNYAGAQPQQQQHHQQQHHQSSNYSGPGISYPPNTGQRVSYSQVPPQYGAEFDNKKAMAESIASRIMGVRR